MEERFKPSKKLRLIFGVLFLVGMVSLVGFAYQESRADSNMPEIDQNQVDDEISRTIIVQLHDGLSSSDAIN